MKVQYIFFNPVIGHHHCHLIDDADSQIVTEVDYHDVKGQKPYTQKQVIDMAAGRTDKLAAFKKNYAISRGIEKMTEVVAEVTPDQQERDKLTSELIAAMEKTKVAVATVDEKIVEVGVK